MTRYLAIVLGLLLATNASAIRRVNGVIAGENVPGNLPMNGNKVTGLGAPTSDSDASTKSYVDDLTGTSQESFVLSGGGDTLSPSGASDVVNVVPSVTAPAAQYSNYHRFNSDTPDVWPTTDKSLTLEAGSAVISAGALDLTNGNAAQEPSAISYLRQDAGGGIGSVNNSTLRFFGFRMNFRLGWEGNAPPVCAQSTTYRETLLYIDNGTAASNLSNELIVYMDGNGTLFIRMYDQLGVSQYGAFVPNTGEFWRKDYDYELEMDCEWGNPGPCEVYLNGTRVYNDSSSFQFWLAPGDVGAKVWFGGAGASTHDGNSDSPGCSSSTIKDFVWFADPTGSSVDNREHSQVSSYNVTYLPPGDSTGFETITKLDTSNYLQGDIVTLVNSAAGEFWEVEPSTSSSPVAGDLAINSKFSPKNSGDRLVVQLNNSGYWAELARHFVDVTGNGPGTDEITLANAATSFAPIGGQDIRLVPSANALAVDVRLKVDYSDNSTEPDFSTSTGSPISADPEASPDYTAEATPTAVGGELDMNTTGFQRSAIEYRADGANYQTQDNVGAVRVLWTPEYNGAPTGSHVGVFTATAANNDSNCILTFGTDANCALGIRIVHETDGELRAYLWNNAGTRYLIATSSFSAVSGTTYELELNYDWPGNLATFFIDGVSQGTAALAGGWAGEIGTRGDPQFILGGMDAAVGTASADRAVFSAQSHGRSNHKYDGFAVFDAVQHTANYTATGLPGVSASVENIDTIDPTDVYRNNQEITIIATVGSRFTLVDSATPTAGQLSLNGNWVPTTSNEMIRLKLIGGIWYELWRR